MFFMVYDTCLDTTICTFKLYGRCATRTSFLRARLVIKAPLLLSRLPRGGNKFWFNFADLDDISGLSAASWDPGVCHFPDHQMEMEM